MKLVLLLATVLGLSVAAPKFPKADSALFQDLVELIDQLHTVDIIKDIQPHKANADEGLLQYILELISLINLNQLIEDFNTHFESDGALAAVIEYLQSDDWNDLVDEVLALDGARDLVDYFADNGVPVDLLLGLISGAIESAEPGAESDSEGSLRSFLDDLEADLNLNDISSFINDNLQSSTTAQNLYKEISSEETHELVEQVRDIDEVQLLAQRLRDMDVNVDDALALAYDFLGWGSP